LVSDKGAESISGCRKYFGQNHRKGVLELSDPDLDEIATLCTAFIEAVTKNEQLQATAEMMKVLKNAIKNGVPKGSPASAAPTFLPVTMPAGAAIGVVDQLRDWRNRWVKAKGYTPRQSAKI
jgi:hypothetical protein